MYTNFEIQSSFTSFVTSLLKLSYPASHRRWQLFLSLNLAHLLSRPKPA